MTIAKRITRLSLLGCSILFFIMIVEAALRIGLIRNEFRDHVGRIVGQSRQGKHKILLLGDSTAKLIFEPLSRKLAARDAALMDGSWSGDGPLTYDLEMRFDAGLFKPDTVILFYSASTDLTDVQYKSKAVVSSYNLFYGSYIFHYLRQIKYALMLRSFDYREFEKRGVDPEFLSLVKENAANPWLAYESAKKRNFIADNLLMETKDNADAWDSIKKLLGDIKERCDRSKSKFVIVIFPSTLQVNESHYVFFEKMNFSVDEKILRSDRPQSLMREFCEEQNMPCLDLLPYLRARRNTEWFQTKDDHLNRAGQEFASAVIADFLEKTRSCPVKTGSMTGGHAP